MRKIGLFVAIVYVLLSGAQSAFAQLGGGAAGTAALAQWDQFRLAVPPSVFKKQSADRGNEDEGRPQGPATPQKHQPLKLIPVKISVSAFSVVSPPAWLGRPVNGLEDSVELIRAQIGPDGITQCFECAVGLRYFPYSPFVTPPSSGHLVPDEQLHYFADTGIEVWAERAGFHGKPQTNAEPVTCDLGSGIAIKIGSYAKAGLSQEAVLHTNVFYVLRRPSGMLWIEIHAPSSQFEKIIDELDKVMASVVFNE